MAQKFLDYDGVLYFWQKIKNVFAPTASPTFTGTPTAPTAATGTSSSQIATTEFVANAVGASTSGVSDVQVDNTSIVTNGIAKIPTVSSSEKGLMSTAMYDKLDSLPANAEKTAWYATCPTASGTAAKVATTSSGDCTLKTGTAVYVKFTYAQTVAQSSLTLNVDSTGAKPIHNLAGTVVGAYEWLANETVCVVYNGSAWVLVDSGKASTSAYGVTKLSDSVSSTSTSVAATPSAVKSAYDLANAAIPSSAKGAASGVCPLNSSSKIDTTYLPSYVDDVIEAYPRSGQSELSQDWLAAESASGTVITPETGKIYVLMADSTSYAANTQFRWGGTAYVKLADGGMTAITNGEIDTIVAS